MMKYRVNTILASESIATAATKIIDIDEATPISRLVIRAKGTNSSSTPTAHPAKILSKIELVDGSDVIYSLSGVQAMGLNVLEEGAMPFLCAEYENNIEVCPTYHINFGRFLWDKEFALDPKRFSNLQLKITHNKALGGSAPDAGTLAVYAYVFDEQAPSPRGFLMSKEHYEYTLTASAHEYIDLPTDYPYRLLAIQSYVSTYAINSQLGNIRWGHNNFAKTVIDNISCTEWIKLNSDKMTVTETFAGLASGSAQSYYIAGTYNGYGTAMARSAADTALFIGQPSGSRVQVTGTASKSFVARVTSGNAFGYVPLTLSDLQDPTDWFNPTKYKGTKLDITAGSGGSGAIAVILQQARSY